MGRNRQRDQFSDPDEQFKMFLNEIETFLFRIGPITIYFGH